MRKKICMHVRYCDQCFKSCQPPMAYGCLIHLSFMEILLIIVCFKRAFVGVLLESELEILKRTVSHAESGVWVKAYEHKEKDLIQMLRLNEVVDQISMVNTLKT